MRVALVILRCPAPLSQAEVIDHCRGRLAGYKTPRQVHFVDDFPRTSIGKVQKAALRRDDGSVWQEATAADSTTAS